MAKRTFKLSINGVPHEVQAEEDTPLIYVLRNDLELKGTRFGCGVNQCGACHVLIDGHSVPACDTPVWAAEGKKIVTVEGLSAEGRLHPLQQAFIEAQAAQCGYCISGILVTAAAFLENNPRPSDAQVREALDKHLCRCGSHNRIVRAVLRAADMIKDKATA